jgi:aspartyl-tRNA(Asn)/glutamyl-tRNA(Gln) amidotransferase subunit C
MAVTPDDVHHVARLARLAVDEAQLPTVVAELNGILSHMDVLQQVELTMSSLATAGDTMATAPTPLRADDAPPVVLMHPREAFAPAMREGFFLVPRLATHEGQGAAADDGEGA